MPLPPEQLAKKAREVRREVIEMIYQAGSGHPGGSLSSTDILTALFFSGCLRFNSHDPVDPRRDRFLLSCGHVCPAYYAVLASCGFFAKEELGSLRALDSSLQGHPSRTHAPFVECSTGSLGQGLGVAAGMALAAFLKNENHFIFVLTSDGEHDEGSLWEAAMFAAAMQALEPKGDWKGLAEDFGVEALDNRYTRRIASAAVEKRRGEVAILAGVGLQSSWAGVSPAQLSVVVGALNRAGFTREARMMAVEAVTRS